MRFPTMQSKLWHKLTNVEMARICTNYFCVCIKCQTTELHCAANIYIQQAFMQIVSTQLLPNSNMLSSICGKHLYSASLYANCVNATAAKLKYVVQHFMLFPMIYSKLGHKFVNVKTARINK